MKVVRIGTALKALAVALSGLAATASWATLGGDASSVSAVARSMGAQDKVSQLTGYSQHELSGSWARVHELAGTDGKVFAVTWRGRKAPDLQSLLGSNLPQFQRALSQARKTHGHSGTFSITVDNLHVEMGGHMGASNGRVWFTDRLPEGMSPDEIH